MIDQPESGWSLTGYIVENPQDESMACEIAAKATTIDGKCHCYTVSTLWPPDCVDSRIE